jgi:hypothetical protein
MYIFEIQGGSNMTGTNCDLFTHNQSRSYLNHLVYVLTCSVSTGSELSINEWMRLLPISYSRRVLHWTWNQKVPPKLHGITTQNTANSFKVISWFQSFTVRWILIIWFWGFTRCVGWTSWRRFGWTHHQWRWDPQWFPKRRQLVQATHRVEPPNHLMSVQWHCTVVTSPLRTYDSAVAEEQLMELRGEWSEQTPQCGD